MLTSPRCLSCPVNRVWSYDYTPGSASTDYVPIAVSRPGAHYLADCLTDFSQTFDGSFFLDLKAGPEVVALEKPEGDGFNLQVREITYIGHTAARLHAVDSLSRQPVL
jgi:hypothetical protein